MKPRPTEAEFAELKRKRDEAMQSVVEAILKEHGVDTTTATVHFSHSQGCYCACPDGPCQHEWDGPEWTDDDGEGGGFSSSATCSRCGAIAMYHDMRCAP